MSNIEWRENLSGPLINGSLGELFARGQVAIRIFVFFGASKVLPLAEGAVGTLTAPTRLGSGLGFPSLLWELADKLGTPAGIPAGYSSIKSSLEHWAGDFL